jgi:uncharacterized RDD family membrane protein YckC
MSVAYVMGVIIVQVAFAMGYFDPESLDISRSTFSLLKVLNIIIAMYFLPLMLAIYQWNLISVQGQTIGKWLLRMKIVVLGGSSPGFLRGVVLRNWLRIVLSVIPFFALVDVLFIYSQPTRCIHDYLAGTRVIDI